MNKTTKTIALFSVLSLMTVGCQKENTADYVPENSVAETSTVCTVQYSIDGVLHQTTLHSKTERTEFFRLLIAMTQNGHEVFFYDSATTSQNVFTKEIVYFSTASEEEALAWADKMVDDGYKVSVTFDPDNKVFNCVARR